MFNAAKDAIASRAALSFINERIRRYGKVERLKIDSGRKQVEERFGVEAGGKLWLEALAGLAGAVRKAG